MADRKHPDPDIPAPPEHDPQASGVGQAERPKEPRPLSGPIPVDAQKAAEQGMLPKGANPDKVPKEKGGKA